LVGLACAGLTSSFSVAARAQNPAAAEALFEEARSAMSAGSFDLACDRFRDSDKLDPAVGTRFNLADCEEKRGRLATAWSMFRGVAAELNSDDDRRPIAEERARLLEPRLPYLTLLRTSATPAGVRVRIDGVELGEASLGVALPMDPGAHELALLRPQGAAEQRSRFVLHEGERANLPIRMREAAPPPAASEPEPGERSEPSHGSTRRTWTFVSGTVGVVGVTVGAIAGVVVLSKKAAADRNCRDDIGRCNEEGVAANESGRRWGVVSGTSFGVGIAGLAAAAYLWLSEPESATQSAHSSSPRRGGVNVKPQLACLNNGGFLSLDGSF